MPYPPIVLDRAASLPLYRQIEVALRRSILDGRIGPGARLPGIRAYARHLGVGAVTVMTAYEQLTAEGYLEARPGRGTVVAPGLPDLRGGLRPRSLPGRGPADDARRPARGVGGAAAAVLRGHPLAAAVRLPDRLHQPRPVPVGGLGAAPAASVARPRLGPGAGDDVPLAGGRPAAARRAGGVPRDVAGGPGDARAGGGDGRRPGRVRDGGPAVADRRADARDRGPVEPASPAHVRGLGRRDDPRPRRRPRAARRPPAGRPVRGARHALVAVPERRHDARRAPDAPARLGRPQPGGRHRGRLRLRAALRGSPAAVAPGAGRGGPGALRRDVLEGAVPGAAARLRRRARARPSRCSSRATRRCTGARARWSSGRSRCSSPKGTSSGTSRASGRTTPSARRRCSPRSPRSSARSCRPALPRPGRTSSSGSRTSASARPSWRCGRGRSASRSSRCRSRAGIAGDRELLLHYARLTPAEIREGVRLLARAAERPRRATA